MAAEEIPHTVEAHPLTGMYNGKFGMWLFLASEVMLFGAMFSTYVLLRVGGASWSLGSELLSVPIGTVNTLILITSSITMVMAWRALKLQNLRQFRLFLSATIALALVFLFVKIQFEYVHKFHEGHYPSTSVQYAVYYTMTGLHGLHILAGILVNLYLLLPGSAMWKTEPERFTNRVECAGLYWHFVDLVWIFLFPVLYLM